jgi:hypothetical protein
MTRRTLVLFTVLLLLAAGSAAASPTAPITLEPPDDLDGDIFNVGFRALEDLKFPYVEEEYLVSGAATVYTYNEEPVRGEIIPLDEDVPYTTRMILRRPVSNGVFKGTVVIEWWNSTAGFDTSPAWDASAEYFNRRGIIYVGVTNSTTSLGFLVGGCRLFGVLPPMCGARYQDLSMPQNGQAYEIMSQIANLLKSDSANNPIPADFEVDRVYHVGQSQQGGSMVTYASAFHFDVNDGYFIQAAGSARPINFQPRCGATGAPAYPDCTPALEGDQRLVRTDLQVPVYRAQTETDMGSANSEPPRGVLGGDSRQDDTEHFRYYEMAGTAHNVVHEGIEVPGIGISLEDFCEFQINSLADGPVFGSYLYNAMWFNMERHSRGGTSPPHGELIETDDGDVARDEFDNALGGIRLPSMEVPIASYGPNNTADPTLPPFLRGIANLACRLSGTVTPFDDETLDTLYPNHGTYVSQVMEVTNELRNQRFLLAKDAMKIRTEASLSQIGCGLGFELALLLPPLMWLRARRRIGRR